MLLKRIICCFALLFQFWSSSKAETSNGRNVIKEGIEKLNSAYNSWSREGFEDSVNFFSDAVLLQQDKAPALYWEGTALFFLSLSYMYSRDEKANIARGAATVKEGIKTLTLSIEKRPDFSEPYALRAVLRGMSIKLKPLSVMKHGPMVGRDRAKALELNRSNPRVHFLTGVSFWHAPEILGGPEKAIEHYLEAEKLFEAEKNTQLSADMPAWGHSMCLAFIGDFYLALKDEVKAKEYYMKSLAVNAEDPLAKKGLKNLILKREK